MLVYFVTSNKGKVRNAKIALKQFGISVKQINLDLVESRSEDPAEIALEKAKQAYAILNKPVIVEDSGFFIDVLGGFPMTHIKFSLKTLGVKNVLRMLKGVKNRKAEWRMTLAYVYGKGKYKTFTLIEKGKIANSLRPIKREMMSDYWRLYIPLKNIANKTLSEMSDLEMDEWQEYYKKNNQFMKFGDWFFRNQ
ncbi:MAG: non-canonical purine NTP pyrophosphatase [Patescibacteria group bacterium]|nr:non-canonical purine NTP pyrophosphatase [Patescibacteria group bacterium]